MADALGSDIGSRTGLRRAAGFVIGAVFSVAIYAWALRTSLPIAKIEQLIRAGAAPADPPVAARASRRYRGPLGRPAVGQ